MKAVVDTGWLAWQNKLCHHWCAALKHGFCELYQWFSFGSMCLKYGGGGWLKQETPRSAIPSHDSLPLSLRAGLRLRGPGWKKEEGRRRSSVWQRGGWDDHLVGLLCVHAHAHTSLTLWLYTVLALIWAVTVLTAPVEKAGCCCPGFRVYRSLHRYGVQNNLGLDIVATRSVFSIHVRRVGLHWGKTCRKMNEM